MYSISHYHTPLRLFSEPDCSTTERVPIPNDTSSERSRRDASNADLFGTDTIPTVGISTMEHRPRGGWCYIHRRTQYLVLTRDNHLYRCKIWRSCRVQTPQVVLKSISVHARSFAIPISVRCQEIFGKLCDTVPNCPPPKKKRAEGTLFSP